MRKYIVIITTAIIGMMASCTNDEIEVGQGISMKVDPSGVIAPFTYEAKTGELESFNTAYKLRTRILAYDEKGLLAAADTAYLTNYAGLMNSTLYLPDGSYNVIAITDVVKYSAGELGLEYWNLTNINDINTVRITDAGFIGGKNKILGVASQKVLVTQNAASVTLKPEPAGALLFINYRHIHQFSDVTKLELETNRTCDFLSFNSQGEYVTIPENNNNRFVWRAGFIEPQDPDYKNSTNIYSYSFSFPMNNVSFRFVYATASDSDTPVSSDMTISLKRGDEYAFILDLYDTSNGNGITYNYGKVNTNSSAFYNNESEHIVSTKWGEAEKQCQSRRLIDLIK